MQTSRIVSPSDLKQCEEAIKIDFSILTIEEIQLCLEVYTRASPLPPDVIDNIKCLQKTLSIEEIEGRLTRMIKKHDIESLFFYRDGYITHIIKIILLMIEIKQMIARNENKESDYYTTSSTPRFDIGRAIKGDPKCFIKTIEKKSVNDRPITVINNILSPLILLLPGYLQKFYEYGLKNYCKLKHYEYSEIIDCKSSDEIRRSLSAEHKNINDFIILDASLLVEINNKINMIMQTEENIFININKGTVSNVIDFIQTIDKGKTLRLSVNDYALQEEYNSIGCNIVKAYHQILSQIDCQQETLELNIASTSDPLSFHSYLPFIKHLKLGISIEPTLIDQTLQTLYFFENLEILSLEIINNIALTTLDLSSLQHLKQVTIKANYLDINKMTLSSSQKGILFDFSKVKYGDNNFKKILRSLTNNGYTIIPPPEEKYSTLFVHLKNQYLLQSSHIDSMYNENPEPFYTSQAHTHKEMTQIMSIRKYKKEVPCSSYRKKILTEIAIMESDIIFKPHVYTEGKRIELSTIQPYTQQHVVMLCKKQPDMFIGVHLASSQWSPLPMLLPHDELVLFDSIDKDKIQIAYCDTTQQYYCKSNQDDIYIHYAMLPNLRKKSTPPCLAELPTVVQQAITTVLSIEKQHVAYKHIHELSQLHAVTDTRKVVAALCDYLSSFTEKDIPAEMVDYAKNQLKVTHPGTLRLITSLLAKVGVCDHSSKLFMVLATYFKIPTRVVKNDVHAFVEYFIDNHWQIAELSSGKIDVLHTIDVWKQKEEEEAKEYVSIISPSPKPLIPVKDQKESLQIMFSQYFSPDLIRLNPATWYQELIEIPHPLLQYHSDHDAWLLHEAFMQVKGNDIGKNYFYIHKPSDIDVLMKQWKITTTGECSDLTGPLATMLLSGKGTLLINWTGCNASQTAHLKSVIDEHPTLNGLSFSKEIRIINIVGKNLAACSAFYSRVKRVEWPLLVSHDMTVIEKDKVDEHAIDLYKRRDWETILIGRLEAYGYGFNFKTGALYQAYSSGKKSIALTGIPEFASFKNSMKRLLIERGFYANGEWCTLPKDFTIYYTPLPVQPALDIKPYDIVQNKKPVFILNKQSYHLFFETYCVNDKEQAVSQKGLLETLSKESMVVMTDTLSVDELRRLHHTAGSRELFALPHLIRTENQSIKTKTMIYDELKKQSTIIISDDIEQTVRLIHSKKTIIMDISELSEFSHIFERLSLKPNMTGKTVGFNRKVLPCLEHLLKGDTVILKGSISPDFYHQIESLFLPSPYLIVNGTPLAVSGRIHLVLNKQSHDPRLFAITENVYHNDFSWDITKKHIERELKKDDATVIIDKIKNFYQTVRRLYPNLTPPFVLSEERVLQMAHAMLLNKNKANPVKALLHINYISHPEVYAHLSVLAKFYLSSEKQFDYDVDKEKFERLKKEQQNPSDKISWQMINCFSPTYLKKHFSPDTLEPNLVIYGSLRSILGLKMKKSKNISDKLIVSTPCKFKIKSNKPREIKQQEDVLSLLSISSFVELRGTPGTGKTFFIEKFAKESQLFWGETAIKNWLESKMIPSYLLLDEANMSPRGHWDFLKGLKTGGIWHQDVFYPVSPDTHKVIMTGNPDDYPGRYTHDFLLHVPKVHFKSHSDLFLHETIIYPLLEDKGSTRILIQCYRQLKTQFPFEPIGLRDIKSVLDHFSALSDTYSKRQKLFLSCLVVFSGLFKHHIARQEFVKQLEMLLSTTDIALTPLPVPDEKNCYILPNSRQLVWHFVNQTLDLREHSIQSKKLITRSGILVEGLSGIGKTQMMLQALKHHKITIHQEGEVLSSKSYIHLTMGSTSISDRLLQAFHAGAIVVIDELNLLSEKDEQLLTRFLEGKSPDHSTAKYPGFTVLASQNPQSYVGRKLLSQALLNRLNCYYESSCTKDDLLEIAHLSKKFRETRHAEQFVERFWNQQAKYPHDINMRNFYETLKGMSDPAKALLQHSVLVSADSTGVQTPVRASSYAPQ